MHIQPIKPEQTVSTTSLYADHVKIYPQRIWGRFRVIKWSALSLLLGMAFGTDLAARWGIRPTLDGAVALLALAAALAASATRQPAKAAP